VGGRTRRVACLFGHNFYDGFSCSTISDMKAPDTNKLMSLTPNYYVVVGVVAALGIGGCYGLFRYWFWHVQLLPGAILAAGIGVLLTPIALFMAAACLYVVFLGGGALLISVLLTLERLAGKTGTPSLSFDAEADFAGLVQGVDGTLPSDDAAKRALGLTLRKAVQFTSGGRELVWAFTSAADGTGLVVARLESAKTFPTFIVDSALNDTSSMQYDAKRLSMERLDLGGDFGDYFDVLCARGDETDVYQVLDPPIMIDTISMLQGMDVVVEETHLDFVFRMPRTKAEAMERFAQSQEYAQLLETKAGPRHVFLQQTISIRRTARSVEKVLDTYFSRMMSVAVIMLMLFIVGGGLASVLDKIHLGTAANWVTGAWAIGFALCSVYLLANIAVIGYAFVISRVADMTIGLLVTIITKFKRHRFARIARAYEP
jgi:hypothetical protein